MLFFLKQLQLLITHTEKKRPAEKIAPKMIVVFFFSVMF